MEVINIVFILRKLLMRIMAVYIHEKGLAKKPTLLYSDSININRYMQVPGSFEPYRLVSFQFVLFCPIQVLLLLPFHNMFE